MTASIATLLRARCSRAISMIGACMLFASAGVRAADDIDGLVDIGTHRLQMHCMGEGAPTVVFEAGLGGLSLEWLAVQQLLAGRVRTCAYDRSGYGLSDPGPETERTSARNADELNALLENAAVEAPYVLVGHSYGGYTMQLFARRHPERVAGLVLVDASHPEQIERFLAPPLNMDIAPRRDDATLVMMRGPVVLPEALPEAARDVAAMLTSLGKTRRAVTEEFRYFRASAMEVRQASPLQDMPLIVLTRGRAERNTAEERGQRAEALWRTLQAELAQMSPRSAHLLARASGHHIHLDQPELVRDAVLLALEVCCGDGATQVAMPVQSRQTARAFRDATWLAINPALESSLHRIARFRNPSPLLAVAHVHALDARGNEDTVVRAGGLQ